MSPVRRATDLQAVLLHRPLQRVHDLPANKDAQVDQQHTTHDDQQLLVLDDLEEETGNTGTVQTTFTGFLVSSQVNISLIYLTFNCTLFIKMRGSLFQSIPDNEDG